MNQNTRKDVSCEWVAESHRHPYARQFVGDHLRQCASCRAATKEDFDDLRSLFQAAQQGYMQTCAIFRDGVVARSRMASTPGTVDASTAFLLEVAEQLHLDAARIYEEVPDNGLRALAWLQQAFFACRAFECEQLIENKIAFEAKRPKVGAMEVPDGSGRTWGDVTSPSTMLKENLSYGTFTFNHEFHGRFLQEVGKNKFLHALVLTCDPAKHGVMSPLLNLAMMAHPEQIFVLGFNAASLAIDAFCQEHNIPAAAPTA